MKLYTTQGDGGMTNTINNRVAKSDLNIHLLGTLDEFTSSLGLAKALDTSGLISEDIVAVQKQIVEVNGQIAGGKLFVNNTLLKSIENKIDFYQGVIGSFNGFVLPGTNTLSAALHISRTIVRRAERVAVELSQNNQLAAEVLSYLNRLSDYIYSLAGYVDLVQEIKNTVNQVVSNIESNTGQHICSDKLSFDAARLVAEEIEKHAKSKGIKVVICIADDGGNTVLLHKMDNAFIASIDIAMNKAFTAASLKMTTEEVGRISEQGSSLYGLQFTNNGRIVIFAGGVPLVKNSIVYGGLGVSGGTAEQDKALAEYGAEIFKQCLY